MPYTIAIAGGDTLTSDDFNSEYASSARGAAERYARNNDQRVAVRLNGRCVFLIEPDGTRLPPGGETVCNAGKGYCSCVPCREERRTHAVDSASYPL